MAELVCYIGNMLLPIIFIFSFKGNSHRNMVSNDFNDKFYDSTQIWPWSHFDKNTYNKIDIWNIFKQDMSLHWTRKLAFYFYPGLFSTIFAQVFMDSDIIVIHKRYICQCAFQKL